MKIILHDLVKDYENMLMKYEAVKQKKREEHLIEDTVISLIELHFHMTC